MASDSSEIKDDSVKSVARIKEYPVIKDSFSKAGEYYTWLKEKNTTINSTLNWTESRMRDVVNKVEPIASSKLESLDKYACSKLDKLETNFPIVKEPTENIVKSSHGYYDSNIKPKVDAAVYYVTSPYRLSAQTIDYLTSTTNNFVEKYMNYTSHPNNSNTTSDASKNEVSTTDMTNHDLIYKRAIAELNTVKDYTYDNFHKLTDLVTMVYSKTIQNNDEWLRKCYSEYCAELDKSNSTQPLDDNDTKVKNLAVALALRLRISTRAICSVGYNHLSGENQKRMDAVFLTTEQFYQRLKDGNYEEIKNKVVIDNVKWIGENSLDLLNNIKDLVFAKYKEVTGKDAVDIPKSDQEESSGECSKND